MVFRLLFSLMAFMALLKVLLWPIVWLVQRSPQQGQRAGKSNHDLEATPLRCCQGCHLHLPETQGLLFREGFFCGENCRIAYYS